LARFEKEEMKHAQNVFPAEHFLPEKKEKPTLKGKV
jgi:hypothetical protein